jgi:hypothetical protein
MIEGSMTFVFSARFSAATGPGAGPPGGQPDHFGRLTGLVFCMPVWRVAGMARRPAGQSGPHSGPAGPGAEPHCHTTSPSCTCSSPTLSSFFCDMYLYLVLLPFVCVLRLFLD